MIYFLGSRDYFVSWLPGYVINLCKGFDKLGVAYEIIMDLDSVKFTKNDALIVIDYQDLPSAIELKHRLGNKAPILVSHSHGSSAFFTGTKAKGDTEKERSELLEMDVVACNTEYHRKIMEKVFGVKAVWTGYPIDTSRILSNVLSGTRDNTIVVGGRLEQDRQLFLAVMALEPYGKRVLFTVPHSREWACKLWGEDTIAKYEDAFRFIWNCNQKRFYMELSKASIVTTFGCVDTLNLSIIEGAILGAYPLVPLMQPYMDYVDDGYEPYSIRDIRYRIDNKPKVNFSVDHLGYEKVAERYANAIEKARANDGQTD